MTGVQTCALPIYKNFTIFALPSGSKPSTNEGADFNRDGKLDFAVGNIQGGTAGVFIGNGDGDHRLPDHGPGPCIIHNTSYDFNDQIIGVGASYFVRLVQRWLSA